MANHTKAGNKPGRRPTTKRRKAIIRKHFKTKKDLEKSKSDGRLRPILKELDDDKDVIMPESDKFRGFETYCEIYDAAQDDSSGNAELILLELLDLLKRDLYE